METLVLVCTLVTFYCLLAGGWKYFRKPERIRARRIARVERKIRALRREVGKLKLRVRWLESPNVLRDALMDGMRNAYIDSDGLVHLTWLKHKPSTLSEAEQWVRFTLSMESGLLNHKQAELEVQKQLWHDLTREKEKLEEYRASAKVRVLPGLEEDDSSDSTAQSAKRKA